MKDQPLRSSNWRCLHPVQVNGNVQPCGALLSFPEADNIWRGHFKHKHATAFNAENKERAAAAAQSGTGKRGGSGGNYGVVTARALLKMQIWAVVGCIGTLTPFSTLHSKLFRSFTQHLNACFSPPHLRTIRKIVRVMKSLIMVELFSRLAKSCSFFGHVPFASASVDLWTAKHANMGYAALDIQFGSPEFEISEATLAVGAIPGVHDADAIKKWIEDSVKHFQELEGVEHPYEYTPASLFKLAVIDGGANIQLDIQEAYHLDIVLYGAQVALMHQTVHRAVRHTRTQSGSGDFGCQASQAGDAFLKVT